MPSPGGAEFGGILRLILDRVNGAGWWPCGARREHTVVQHQVDPRPWRQHGQPFQQLQRIEAQMRRAIRPAVPQRQPDLAVTGPVQPLLGEGRAQREAAHPLQPIAVAGSNDESGVPIEPVGARVTGPSVVGATAFEAERPKLVPYAGRLATPTFMPCPYNLSLGGRLLDHRSRVLQGDPSRNVQLQAAPPPS